MKFNITHHCKNRYIERILNNSRKCDNLYKQILSDLDTGQEIQLKLTML